MMDGPTPEIRTRIDNELESIIRDTVSSTLLQIGVDYMNPIEMQKDLQYLRQWRKSSEAVRKKGLLTFVSVLVTGIIGAVIVAISKGYFSN